MVAGAEGAEVAHRPMVLLVDDNPRMRDALCAVFGIHGGFRIGGVAADGLQAALLAAEIQPDVVVLDETLPRWDGPRAAEFIRLNCPHTKIVALSPSGVVPDWADGAMARTALDLVVEIVSGVIAA